MLITSLKQTSPEHVTVCLEDGGEIRTTLGVVTELRLFNGRDLDHDALNRLQSQSGRALAREKALQLISQRQMSRRELGKKLKEKGFDPETADYCVDWVTERGLLEQERKPITAEQIARNLKIQKVHQMLRAIGRARRGEELSTKPKGRLISFEEMPKELFDKFFGNVQQ